MEGVVCEIVEAKNQYGKCSFLRLRLDGECTLWNIEPTPNAKDIIILGRWQLNNLESDQLIDTSLVDYDV